MGSLWMAVAAHREAKAREIENILTLSEHHRNLWNGVAQRPELEWVIEPNVNFAKNPATLMEEVFLNESIAHFMTGWRVPKAGCITFTELAADVRRFFALPLPRAAREKTKKVSESAICAVCRADAFRNKHAVRKTAKKGEIQRCAATLTHSIDFHL